jgi:hypothetical protein
MDCRCLRNYQFIQKNLDLSSASTIEFDRDWNLETTAVGNQSLLVTGLHLNLGPTAKPNNIGILKYQFEKLDFFKSFSGNRHSLNGYFKLQNWTFQNQGSYLKVTTLSSSNFIRNQSQIRFHLNKTGLARVSDLRTIRKK